MVERQLRCDLLRLILVAGWFVPFWRDTARREEREWVSASTRPRARGERGTRAAAVRRGPPLSPRSFFLTESRVSVNRIRLVKKKRTAARIEGIEGIELD